MTDRGPEYRVAVPEKCGDCALAKLMVEALQTGQTRILCAPELGPGPKRDLTDTERAAFHSELVDCNGQIKAEKRPIIGLFSFLRRNLAGMDARTLPRLDTVIVVDQEFVPACPVPRSDILQIIKDGQSNSSEWMANQESPYVKQRIAEDLLAVADVLRQVGDGAHD